MILVVISDFPPGKCVRTNSHLVANFYRVGVSSNSYLRLLGLYKQTPLPISDIVCRTTASLKSFSVHSNCGRSLWVGLWWVSCGWSCDLADCAQFGKLFFIWCNADLINSYLIFLVFIGFKPVVSIWLYRTSQPTHNYFLWNFSPFRSENWLNSKLKVLIVIICCSVRCSQHSSVSSPANPY